LKGNPNQKVSLVPNCMPENSEDRMSFHVIITRRKNEAVIPNP